jgi:hypothetical protein
MHSLLCLVFVHQVDVGWYCTHMLLNNPTKSLDVRSPEIAEATARAYEKYIVTLRQQCHNSKFVIFREKLLKVLKCYNFVWVQGRRNCPPAASFANSVMTLYLLKVHLQTFLSIPIAPKCKILSCDTLAANERYVDTRMVVNPLLRWFIPVVHVN